jgi:sulfur carrier protein ThiS
MKAKMLKPVIFSILLGSGIAYAAGGKVTISAPMEGAMVGTKDKIAVKYEADPGPDGDHLHLNVDGKRIEVLRPLKGSAEAGPLSAGKHQICIAINTKAHVPTGTEGCVNVTAK